MTGIDTYCDVKSGVTVKPGFILKYVNNYKNTSAASYLPTVEVTIVFVGVQLAADTSVVIPGLWKR